MKNAMGTRADSFSKFSSQTQRQEAAFILLTTTQCQNAIHGIDGVG